MGVHVIHEARRCLQCEEPLCMQRGCPLQTDIPEMIRLFLSGRGNQAGIMLFENNPMSDVCSLVCDHEKQCEGHCILGKEHGTSAVQISSIEHYISNTYLHKYSLMKHAARKEQRVAVIGAGPAGLTVATKLAQHGYDVTIFERMSRLGGMMRYGIPDFRLPREILDTYEKKLKALGVHIRPHTTLGGTLHLDDLFDDGYAAVFVGTGVWRPRRLGVKGETNGNCHFAIDYLKDPSVYELGRSVVVIGSSNVSMDAARTAIRYGAEQVYLVARHYEVSSGEREADYAQADGVEFIYARTTKEITPDGPMLAQRHFDADGHCVSEDEPELLRVDSVIIAVNQDPKDKVVRTTKGLKTNENGLITVDKDGHTTREGVFSGGDVVLGAHNVVTAVKDAKKVAAAMEAYLEQKAAEDENKDTSATPQPHRPIMHE